MTGRRFDLPSVDRRTLLIGGAGAAGLVLAWSLWPRAQALNLPVGAGESVLTAFIKVGRDGQVTMIVPGCESGQGITTALPQIMAEELGADWRTVAVEAAPINAAYVNPVLADPDRAPMLAGDPLPSFLGDVRAWKRRAFDPPETMMLTGASSSIRAFEGPCRAAAAAARAMLMMAAAARWDVDWQECETHAGFVTHDKRRLRFAELAAEAAEQEPPAEPVFRANVRTPLFGEEVPRLDAPAKVDGSLNFAGDIRLPDMVYAAIRQGPHGDTRLSGIDKRAAARIPGMVSVVEDQRWVAAVARTWWAANRALDALAPRFTTAGPVPDDAAIATALVTALSGDGAQRVAERGDAAGEMAGRKAIAATYAVAPSLHAAIETPTATAAPDGDRMRLWVATQAPALCRAAVARALDIAPHRVTLFPMQAGGSFGAAIEHDVAVQAAKIARAIDRPVQLVWSRAETILRDLPRPPAMARLSAVRDTGGGIHALHTRIAVPAAGAELRSRLFDGWRPDAAAAAHRDSVDASAVGGAVPPYRIAHLAVEHAPVATALPAGMLRGLSDGYTAFFTESFVDECAHAAETDPLSYRLSMLGSAPRLAECLARATMLGEWDGGAAGSGMGIACHALRGSFIALLARAAMGENGIAVQRLVAVADVGRVVNPALVRQAIEGGLIFGLAAAVGATVDYRGGVATARRLGQLGLPRIDQTPEILVELIDSQEDPGGASEIAVPVVAPALANALFSATGRRFRRLPLSDRPVPGGGKTT